MAAPNRDTTAAPEPSLPTAQDLEEANVLRREGLPPDAVVLVPPIAASPMRQPANTWAMLVLAVDVLDDTDPDRKGEVALFAGCWLLEQPHAASCEGDLVLRLHEPDAESPRDDQVHVEMLLAHGDRWQRVAGWERLGPRWPWTVAATAAAIMGLQVEATEAAVVSSGAEAARQLQGWRGNGGLVDLLAAGLVHAGEQFIWNRPGRGARHTARIRSDGTLVLADGRVYVNPSGALTALGGKHQNGWKTWKRTSDGRTLGDLRAELHSHREE
ncbi:MAG TPA: hypothetical protein VF821_11705 [Lentzea sp.]